MHHGVHAYVDREIEILTSVIEVLSLYRLCSSVQYKYVLFLVTRLVAYWPAPIHAVAHGNL